ncbi:phosphate signaling complex protein PhoU [Kutzneria viridogrisea]|uniref:PhoU domain-containing protein n=2 Tax=Kutzneria TaxID=43356 RepID=W5WHN5_9PSEU|nr:PhoU domain-containing protein [Kutzneria albida]AHI00699.1 hypothetical protein KALB_7341 [Kutzneria albida DSM 43870]MBA8925878.1 phosphate transport system protein [Kutzneria viridogrisea]
MRKVHHRHLRRLGDELAAMCGLVGEAMQRASQALLDADLVIAEKVIADDAKIVRARAECEEHAHELLSAHTDLRAVFTVLHAADRLEQMGDLALHIARTTRRRHPAPVLPELLRDTFADLGQLAVTLANTTEQVLRTRDPELTDFLDSCDDIMDDLYRAVSTAVTAADWPHGVAAAVDVALLGQCYERFADHAVSLARRTSVLSGGKLAASA